MTGLDPSWAAGETPPRRSRKEKTANPKAGFLFVITGPTITRPVITSGRDGQHTSKIERMQAIQKALGARIRELRLKRSWSQEEFADVCGIHRSHMGEIERGETNLTLSTLLVISQKLEVSISSLFRGIA